MGRVGGWGPGLTLRHWVLYARLSKSIKSVSKFVFTPIFFLHLLIRSSLIYQQHCHFDLYLGKQPYYDQSIYKSSMFSNLLLYSLIQISRVSRIYNVHAIIRSTARIYYHSGMSVYLDYGVAWEPIGAMTCKAKAPTSDTRPDDAGPGFSRMTLQERSTSPMIGRKSECSWGERRGCSKPRSSGLKVVSSMKIFASMAAKQQYPAVICCQEHGE